MGPTVPGYLWSVRLMRADASDEALGGPPPGWILPAAFAVAQPAGCSCRLLLMNPDLLCCTCIDFYAFNLGI